MQTNNFLSPHENLIFRIVHLDNVPWILENGLHCRNSDTQDSDYVDVGNEEIIERRRRIEVKIDPFGTLSDYIPFYFTPWSVMLYNIVTGHNVPKVAPDKIVMIVSRLTTLQKHGIKFVFTDRHALLVSAKHFDSIADLEKVIDWKILRNKDFKRDNEDPGKIERYQAEALIYRSMPLDAVSGIVCASTETKEKIISMVEKRNFNAKVIEKAEWFF